MYYFAEFFGSFLFLSGGFAYLSNANLKNTFVKQFSVVECALAWGASLALGIGICTALGGPAAFSPAVLLGLKIMGLITWKQAGLLTLMEFFAAGAAVFLTMLFYWKNFKQTPGTSKRDIFAAYPVEMDLKTNFLQEIACSFLFIFVLLLALMRNNPLIQGAGEAGQIVTALVIIFWIAYTWSLSGWSMNPMRSVFSSIWYAILPVPNKCDKVDWKYQILVNLFGSSIGIVPATCAAVAVKQTIGVL